MAEGFLGGIGDFFTGGGVYADPKAINPTYGVPEGDVRQAAINQLGQMSALLLAAGQPMEGSQRAQLLSQIGGTGNQFNTNLYNAAQRRLMTGQMQEKQKELEETNVLRELQQKDPVALAQKLGGRLTPDQVSAIPVSQLRTIASQIIVADATRDPVQRELSTLKLGQAKSEMSRTEAVINQIDRDQRLTDAQRVAFKQDPAAYIKFVAPGPREYPEAVRNYQFYVQQEQDAGRQPKNFEDYTNSLKKAGAQTITIGSEGEPDTKTLMELSKDEGARLSKQLGAATTAAGLRQDIDYMKELLQFAPQGPITGRLAQAFPGVSSAGAALDSVVNRLAPTLRIEGSGATSDKDYEAILRGLPALRNKPDANALIAEAIDAKANLMVLRGDVINAWQNREIDAKEMRKQLRDIDSRSIITPRLRQALEGVKQGSGTTPSASFSAGGGTVTMNPDGSYTYGSGR
jgi:hypothetical protein